MASILSIYINCSFQFQSPIEEKETVNWEKRCLDFEHKHRMVLTQVENAKRNLALLKYQLKEKTNQVTNLLAKNEKLERDIVQMKEVCNELTKTSNDFVKEVIKKKNLFTNSNDSLVVSLRNELDQSKREIARMKHAQQAMELDFSSQKIEFRNKLASEQIQNGKLARNLKLEQENRSKLQDRISWLERNIEYREAQIEDLNKQCQYLNNQLAMVKEEASMHISSICVLRTEIEHLNEESRLNEQVKQMWNEKFSLNEKKQKMIEKELKEERVKNSQIVEQHKKVIDYLIAKKDSKKSKVSV